MKWSVQVGKVTLHGPGDGSLTATATYVYHNAMLKE